MSNGFGYPTRGMQAVQNRIVDLEVTSYCNAKCIMCPRNISRPQGLMSPTTFYQIAGELINSNTGIVNFCGYGEPLVNEHIIDYIRHLTDNGVTTVMRTNGSQLDRATAVDLVEAGINTINISVHGITQLTYEKVMQRLNHRTLLDNLNQIYDVLSEAEVNLIINCVDMLPNHHEVEHMVQFWSSWGIDNFELNPVHSRGGSLSHREIYPEDAPASWDGYCPIFPFVTYIAWNGDVLACCQDAVAGQLIIGNLTTSSFPLILRKKNEYFQEKIIFPRCNCCDKRVTYDWLN